MQIDLFLSETRQQIENTLEKLVAEKGQPLLTAARYSLLAPAKRLRPLLIVATALSYGASLERCINPACALEMIHTYSLIHDDLPCMDDDDLRRGRPTLHKVVPEWHALLTGDYLLTYAFEILAKAPHLDDGQKIALITLFSAESGSEGMIGGQMIDLLSQKKQISWELLEEMHSKKTASLIRVALKAGAIIGRAPQKDSEILQAIGTQIGIAFQLVDDLLDATGDSKKLGKPVGSDAEKEKATAISILGIEQTQAEIDRLESSIETLYMDLSQPHLLLKALLNQLIRRQY